MRHILPAIVLLAACSSENDLRDPNGASIGADDGTAAGVPDDQHDPEWSIPGYDPSSDPGDPDDPDYQAPVDDDPSFNDPPGRQGPPLQFLDDDCETQFVATFTPDQIWVGSWDNPFDQGTLTAPEAGWFDLYNTHIAESGSSQRNEAAWFRVTNATNPTGQPLYGNCGDEWVVEDADNNGPAAGNQIYIGTYWLEEGDNVVEMRHYCPEYRAGQCAGFHDTQDSDKTCDSGNVNSVHFDGYAVCLIPAE